MTDELAEILVNCEAKGTAPGYVVQQNTYRSEPFSLFKQSLPLRSEPVKYSSPGEEIFVISDLHIAAGRNKTGVYNGNENFFADEAFDRFLSYGQKNIKTNNALLIINGDTFDFLRITEYPGKIKKPRLAKRLHHWMTFGKSIMIASLSDKVVEDEYSLWSAELKKCGINRSPSNLRLSISEKEKKYGLQTDDYKTIYKLIKIRHGHHLFFQSLAFWLNAGNRIMLIKGNHDLELCWPAVRNYIRLILAEEIKHSNSSFPVSDILLHKVLPNLSFIDDGVVINDIFYLEHGHRYDKFTMVLSSPFLEKNPSQVNIPFGSFFNRYLINRVELYYPNLDKVRPTGNILPMLVRDDFPLALKILGEHVPFMIRILSTNFRYVRFMLQRVFWLLLAFLVPIIIAGAVLITKIKHSSFPRYHLPTINSFITSAAKGTVTAFMSYLLSRLIGWLQLKEPSTLNDYAKMRFAGTSYEIMAMGHTHNPGEYVFDCDQRFYNTGTWIPVIETSTAEVREDKTFTYLHLIPSAGNKLSVGHDGWLQRWNDDAVRPEAQVLVERKF